MHVYIYTHTHTYIYIHIHTYIHTHTHLYIYIYTHMNVPHMLSARACMNMCQHQSNNTFVLVKSLTPFSHICSGQIMVKSMVKLLTPFSRICSFWASCGTSLLFVHALHCVCMYVCMYVYNFKLAWVWGVYTEYICVWNTAMTNVRVCVCMRARAYVCIYMHILRSSP